MKFHTKAFIAIAIAALALTISSACAQVDLATIPSARSIYGSHDSVQAQSSKKKISIGSAFVRSALIPGWGQRATGANKAARNFFVAEVGLWLGVISFNVHGNWLQDDYRLLASEHAQVDTRDKSDVFYVDIGNFTNIDEFNQSRLQRRDVAALYDPATHYWQWDTEANRNRFADLRLRSDKAFSRSELFIAAILGNHIISGIHAAWLARRHNSNVKSTSLESTPQVGLVSFGDEIRLTAQVKF